MKFTLRQLQIFLAVARYQNISRAADSLHMSQSAASEALRNLESTCEVKLFNRAKNKLTLNAMGQTLRGEAENLFNHSERVEAILLKHSEIGHIRVGASFTIGNHLATRYLSDYLSQFPEARVELDTANTPEIINKVLNYEVDIGMIEGEVQRRELNLIPWRNDELVIFCAAKHPLAKKKILNESDIKEARWILREPESGARHTFETAMAGLLPEINIHLEFRHNEAIKNAVEAGLGVGCLSSIVLHRNFAHGDLTPLVHPRRKMLRTFYFALPKKRLLTTAVNAWMNTCRKMDKEQENSIL